jgi:hypothetical protein
VASGSTVRPFRSVQALSASGGVARLGNSAGGAGSQLGLGEFGFER